MLSPEIKNLRVKQLCQEFKRLKSLHKLTINFNKIHDTKIKNRAWSYLIKHLKKLNSLRTLKIRM